MGPHALKILIPLDETPASEAILPALLPLFRSHQVGTTLLHVTGPRGDGSAAMVRLDALRQGLEAQGVATRVLIHSGRAAGEIAEVANSGRFDLVAMGTHGRTCMDRVIMGSVAEEVIRTSRIPVLLTRPGVRGDSWDKMVVALDGTAGSEEILEDVVRLARALHAAVTLVHVDLPNQAWDEYAASPEAFPKADTMAYLNRIAGLVQERGVSASVSPVQGKPGDEIPRLARSVEAGLICMATEGRPDSFPGVGNSTSAEVIGKAPCAVYVRQMSGVRGLRRERP